MWAMATRCDPATSIDILRRMRTSPADPRLTPEQRKARDLTNSRMVVDAPRPYDWQDQFLRLNAPSQESARSGRETFGYVLQCHPFCSAWLLCVPHTPEPASRHRCYRDANVWVMVIRYAL